MTSITFFFIFIPLLALILLAVNFIFAPHSPYQEKDSVFECGFHSFLGQNRTQFSISFFIFALLFLLFDLEILLVYPYVVSAYTNGLYGLIIMLIFFLVLTLGFAFELGKNALKIDSKQSLNSKSIIAGNFLLIPTVIGTFLYTNSFYLIVFIITLFMIGVFGVGIIHYLEEEEVKAPAGWKEYAEFIGRKWDPRAKIRHQCKHDWEVYNEKIKCEYTVAFEARGGRPCTLENDINWICKQCNEIRCGVHTHTHHGPNKGHGLWRNP